MEIAIRVVVVFFVALVVAGSIIYFAEDVFTRANDLNPNEQSEEEADTILQVETLDQTQFDGLLRACATRVESIETIDCFAVTSQAPINVNVPSNVSGIAVEDNFTASSTSMFIRYDLGSNQIVVE